MLDKYRQNYKLYLPRLIMKKKKLLIFLALLTIFIAWSVTLYYYSPSKIIEKIGIQNSYLILGILALIGGTSIFLPFPYYIFTISFGAAGLNPLLLGIFAGIGTLVGDTTSYYLGYKGREIVPKKLTKHFKKISHWATHEKQKHLLIFTFLYTAFIPLSDDIIMIPAGAIKYPFLKLATTACLGKIVFNTLLALSGFYGFNLFFG